MALVCSSSTTPLNPFTFIDCSTINISYDIKGLATVSFTVISTSKIIDLASYTTVSFGSTSSSRSTGAFRAGRVQYKGYVTNYELVPIAGTVVFEHRIQLLAWGCKE